MNGLTNDRKGTRMQLPRDQVLAAARSAWGFHREPVDVRSTAINGHTHMMSLTVFRAKRIEFVVEEDDPDVWETLARVEPADTWQLCALVPLRLLGIAHDRLREHGFELQGWWLDGERVAFSSPEIA